MKNKHIFINLFMLIIFIFSFICSIIPVKATSQARVTPDVGAILRKGPGTNNSKIVTVPKNGIVTILQENIPSEEGCTDSNWSKITYDKYEGYICAKFLEPIEEVVPPESDMAKMTEAEYEEYLNKQGFPESYKVKLRELHKLHPNWIFVGVKTKYNWNDALKNQNVAGRSFYQSTSTASQGFLSTDDAYYNFYTDTFKVMEGKTWYQANVQTIAYYLDPRNFLNDDGIFMFEKLGYNPSFQTSAVVKNLLYTSFYDDLIPYFMEAAQKYQVSPVYLAAKARQEVGLNGGVATNGKGGDYCGNSSYNGYYNFYAIGATSGVCKGMEKAHDEGWSTKQKAIVEGAKWIVNGYISANQDTAYFQKFNTSIYATKAIWHQYAADVRYAASTASTTKNSYKSSSLIDYAYVFDIPIYEGIPDAIAALPKSGNPNNYLKTLKVNSASVTNFDGAKTTYTVNVPYNTESIKIEATTVNSTAKISGIPSGNTVTITDDNTDINIVVTAGNGATKTYTLKIVRLPAPVTPPTPVEPDDKDQDGNKDNNENEDNTNPSEKEPSGEVTKPSEDIVYPTPDETITKAGYKIKDTNYMYNLTLGSTVAGVISKIQTANPYASINITNSSNQAKTSGSIVTGDKVTINSNGNSKTFIVIIYGDLNGDGEINVVDLGKLQKHILKTSTLTGAYLKAADVDKNNNITIVDLGKVQKHLLKTNNISQS